MSAMWIVPRLDVFERGPLRVVERAEAVAEDEAVLEDSTQTLMAIPNALVPSVQALLSQHDE